jgi:hypothetical protein
MWPGRNTCRTFGKGKQNVGYVNRNVNIKIYKTVGICAILGFYVSCVGGWLPVF